MKDISNTIKEEKQNYHFIETNTPYFIENLILLKRHKQALPPKESYLFFPRGDEIILLNNKKPEKSLRRIFYNTPYTEYENNKIKTYKRIINSHPENKELFPKNWNDALNLMFIYSTDCDLEKAYERMIKYFKWYNNFFPLSFTPKDKVIEILNSGFAYCFGRDHEFRPNLIVQPYIYQDKLRNHSGEDLLRACIFLCEYVKNNLLIPGQIENWNMIVNLKGTNILTVPDPIKKVITCLSDNFLAKLYKTYIFNLSLILRILYKLICKFLEEVTVNKFVIITKNDRTILNYIRSDNLEKKFGGDVDNFIYSDNNLFPPNMPLSGKFLLDNENPKELLITPEEYKKRIKNLPEESLSPFILEEIKNEEKEKKLEEEKRNKEEILIKLKEEQEKNEKDINDMMFENDWEIKDEFLQNEINEISNPNFISYSFQKYLNNFNTNKNECNWELYKKKS